MLFTFFEALLSGEGVGYELIAQLCAIIFISFCCLPIHESAHAWTASKLGDNTGRLKGRITLNPMAHLSPVGTVMMFLFGFGFAKAVPVNINNFPPKKRKFYFGITAVAGPLSNLLLSLIFALISNGIYFGMVKSAVVSDMAKAAYLFFYYAAFINVSLAVFNLLPVPPLDGSRVLTAVLPDRIYYKIMGYERYLMYGLFLLIFLFNRIGFSPISLISAFVYEGIDRLAELPYRLFL